MKKLALILLFVSNLLSPVAMADPSHECGAAWEIKVGLDATFLKMTEGGPMEAPELKNWAHANGLPNVSGGSATEGNIKYIKYDSNNPPAKREYALLSMMFLENENFDGKIKLRVSLSRLDPDGNYKSVMVSNAAAPNFASLGSSAINAEISKWIGTMQGILQKELKPTEVTYTLSKHVVDAEHPEEIVINVTGFKDKYGAIKDNGTQRLFCINFEYREIYQKASIGPKTMKALLSGPVTLDQAKVKQVAEKGCIDDINHCSRPMGKFAPLLTKSFGAYWDDSVLKTTDEKKEQITIVCPINIAIPEPPVMIFMPGDQKNVSFHVTTINDEPAANMIMSPVKLTPSSFGSFNLPMDATDLNGFNTELVLRTRQNAPEGLTGEVAIELCKNTKPEEWGRDENGNPIPWNLKAVQPVKISQMPMVNIDITSKHVFEISMDHRFEDSDNSRREYRRDDVDEEFRLTVEDARLGKREVKHDYTDDLGFKGTLIEYKGEAVAKLDLSKPIAGKDVERHSGYYKSHECGNVPFDFEKHHIEHQFTLRKPQAKVVVYYRHYIPDPNSSVQKHPLEGLGIIQTNPMDASISYLNASTYRKAHYEDCSVRITTSPAPRIPLPVVASNFFPVSAWTFMDDCYGLEQVTVPLKEKDFMSGTLRKWNPETQTFDELHLSKQIDLSSTDSAECWDVSDRTETEWYEPGTTFVRGGFTYDFVADLVSGSFDFNAQ